MMNILFSSYAQFKNISQAKNCALQSAKSLKTFSSNQKRLEKSWKFIGQKEWELFWDSLNHFPQALVIL